MGNKKKKSADQFEKEVPKTNTDSDAVETKCEQARIVAPVITLVKKAVSVKKKYATATRQTVVLKTDKAYSGKGTFTCASDCVKFFQGSKEIAAASGVLFESVGSGITLEIEGVKPSALEGVDLSWKLEPGAEPVVGSAATDKLTAVEATLDLFKKDGSTKLTEDEKHAGGRVVHKQNTAKSLSRAKLTVKCEPAEWSGTLVLAAIRDNVQLFDAKTGGGEVTLPKEIGVGPGLGPFEYWVQGKESSGAKDDTGFTLAIKTLADASGKEADRARMTVVGTELELYTSPPGGSPAKLDAAAKIDPGRLLLVQDAKFTRARTKLAVIKKPKDAPCKLILKEASGAGRLTLFPAANDKHATGEAPVALPKEIAPDAIADEAKGMVFWIDGKDFSTAAQETVLQLDADGVDDACDKAALTVVDLRDENGNAPAPHLVPVKNPITEPANAHKRKIKLEHKIAAGGTYAWTSSSARFTTENASTQTVTLVGKEAPSDAALAEELEVLFSPTGKTAFPKLAHKVGVVEIVFSKHGTYKGGYDKYEDMPFGCADGTADGNVKQDPKYDFVSIEKSQEGKVVATHKGAEPAEIFFTSADASKADPKTKNPTASPFDVVITGKALDRDETVIEGRIESATGPIVAKLGAVVLKKYSVEAEFYAVSDSNSLPTAVSQHAVTKDQLNQQLEKAYLSAIAELKITACHDKDVEYDTAPKNGILDLKAGAASTEENKIRTECAFDTSKQNIVCVKDLQWIFALGANLTLKKTGQSVITLAGTPKFFAIGNWYYLEDDTPRKVAVVVKAIDEIAKTATVEVHTATPLAADTDFTTAKNARMLMALNGLSGNPVWVKDQTGVEALANVIGHEIGHIKFGFADLCEKANLMHFTAVGGGNWGLRHRGVKQAYSPGGDEEQWKLIPGKNKNR